MVILVRHVKSARPPTSLVHVLHVAVTCTGRGADSRNALLMGAANRAFTDGANIALRSGQHSVRVVRHLGIVKHRVPFVHHMPGNAQRPLTKRFRIQRTDLAVRAGGPSSFKGR